MIGDKILVLVAIADKHVDDLDSIMEGFGLVENELAIYGGYVISKTNYISHNEWFFVVKSPKWATFSVAPQEATYVKTLVKRALSQAGLSVLSVMTISHRAVGEEEDKEPKHHD